MNLDFDIGNTRVKWRLQDQAGVVLSEGVLLHSALQSLPQEWHPDRVRMSAVNGQIADYLCDLVLDRWGLDVERARVTDGACGVKCGYRTPEKLGVDRWLAIMAAWRKFQQSLLVVDAGSALTLDVVTSKGLHKGGFIIPGREMMTKSLGHNTWGVNVPVMEEPGLELGRDTGAAVNNGILSSLVGTVETVARRTGVEKVVITGGDAETILNHLDAALDANHEPGLVIDGLAIAIP